MVKSKTSRPIKTYEMPVSGDKHPDGIPEGDPNRVMEGDQEVTYDEYGNPEVLMQLGDTNQISGTMQGSTGGGAVGGYGKKRVGQESRRQMNLTSGRTKSILTS
jgi:hypothetical protein